MTATLLKDKSPKEIFIENLTIQYNDKKILNYDDFLNWYESMVKYKYKKDIKFTIQDFYEIYYAFQVFYYDLKRGDIETITLINICKRIFDYIRLQTPPEDIGKIKFRNMFYVFGEPHKRKLKNIREKILSVIKETEEGRKPLLNGEHYDSYGNKPFEGESGINSLFQN